MDPWSARSVAVALLLAAGTAGIALAALAFGYTLVLGAAFGLLSMAADLASSFVKRRLQVTPGTERPLLDQLPEALVPLVVLSPLLQIGLVDRCGIASGDAGKLCRSP